jgi:hypothetical protein
MRTKMLDIQKYFNWSNRGRKLWVSTLPIFPCTLPPIEKGHLKKEDSHLVFTKDIEFSSPGTAGSVVHGGNTNGPTNWKDSSGKQLKEIEANQL